MADVHGFTPFAFQSDGYKSSKHWKPRLSILKNIYQNYGQSKFLITIGDSVSFGRIRNDLEFVKKLGGNMSTYDAVYMAGVNAHNRTREMVLEAGFEHLLPVVGDHELGGNEGFRVGKKVANIPAYRQSFADGYFKGDKNLYDYSDDIAGASARPFGTTFEGSSYAFRFRNIVFVAVDVFQLVGDGSSNFFDRKYGTGGEGTHTFIDEHLAWFEDVLSSSRGDPTIAHVFVAGHVPILQPVRAVKTSGQFFDLAEESAFWKLMIKYDVDFYLGGDVHSNTVTKSMEQDSNTIQIISRANSFGGFLVVNVIEDKVQIDHYNEIDVGAVKFNNNYVKDGSLTVDKSAGTRSIESEGELLLHDNWEKALIYFDFEELKPIDERQVLGLRGENELIPKSLSIDGIMCTDSFRNNGIFDAQYDAQVGNVTLSQGRYRDSSSAQFHPDSRVAIFGTGPLHGGQAFSISLWFRTEHIEKEMVLAFYGSYWGGSHGNKDYFLFTLDQGIPTIYLRNGAKSLWAPTVKPLADNFWHNIVVTMPFKSCRPSDMKLFVDGNFVRLTHNVDLTEEYIFFFTAGRLSIGGFGYGGDSLNHDTLKEPYDGQIDDVSVFGRSLEQDEISGLGEQCSNGLNCGLQYCQDNEFTCSSLECDFVWLGKTCKPICMEEDCNRHNCSGCQFCSPPRKSQCSFAYFEDITETVFSGSPSYWYQLDHSGSSYGHERAPLFRDIDGDGVLDYFNSMHGHTIVNSNGTLDGRFEIALSRVLEDGTIQLQPIDNRIVIEDEVDEYASFYGNNIGFIDSHGEQLMDLDGDGILDLYIVQGGNRGELVRNPKMQDNLLFFGEINDNNLVFRGGRKQAFDAGLHGRNGRGRQPFIFDANGDGLLDIFIVQSRRTDNEIEPGILLLNQGNRTWFEHKSMEEFTRAVILTDIDGDGIASEVIMHRAFCFPQRQGPNTDPAYEKYGPFGKQIKEFCSTRPVGTLAGYRFNQDSQKMQEISPQYFNINADSDFQPPCCPHGAFDEQYGCNALAIASGDFDSDLLADHIFLYQTKLVIYYSSDRPQGTLPIANKYSSVVLILPDYCLSAKSVRVTDFNNDSEKEIFIMCKATGAFVFYTQESTDPKKWILHPSCGRNDSMGDISKLSLAYPKFDNLFDSSSVNCEHFEFKHIRKACVKYQSGKSLMMGAVGLTLVDLNNDGFTDAVYANAFGYLRFLLNKPNKNDKTNEFIVFELKGDGTNTDVYGIGATLILTTERNDGLIRKHFQEYSRNGDKSGYDDPRVYFGLGKDLKPVSIQITWLTGHQQEQDLQNWKFNGSVAPIVLIDDTMVTSTNPNSVPSFDPVMDPSESPSFSLSDSRSFSPATIPYEHPSMSSEGPLSSPSIMPSFGSDAPSLSTSPSQTPSKSQSDLPSVTDSVSPSDTTSSSPSKGEIQIFVDQSNVEYGGTAKMFTCAGTNTNMISGIKDTGYLNFIIDLQCSDIDVEVSYVSRVVRKIHITVNNEKEQVFDFSPTGEWCFRGGTSSSMILNNLSGWKKGMNTLSFKNPTRKASPLVEWVKFKEKCSATSN
ncbi:hypothetical protein CTEN210_17741 [Chaetoceros tenuissimus]|uniref:Laminin G domain-containing protein n=1 Tax=Chaetoceros tenuissimus TaxID=426638 RepID=A0AAD3HF22_9STRA|nr:hypothetical protein CTEN210_17741 [Chaetoceros tenuissimus]